ncbi:phosphoinositide 3-kinase adapter protein 1-like isoform X8 [Lytechinus variegatus]|uniref:phosphoinositide 3-kinase adapter protein 1-like isoform X8 n=1 Tax=Lytechinus variegatus TaxID=7654 RepID=UPI001BB13DC5|nr:phosphoinositide 3-kinase adapter protein 1-like isoform X8 [Lytechinus variegatus]
MAGPGTDTVYDLTILYMSDVTNWCEYLFDIFNPFEVYQQSEEITTFPTHESTIHHIRSSRVQVLIISPKFIETATSQIREITGPNSVVGLLCGVEREELVRLQDRIPDYVNWHLVDAKDGPRCITSTTLDIVDEMIKLADRTGSNDLYLPMVGVKDDEQNNYMSMERGLPSGVDQHQDQDTYQSMTGAPQEDLYLDMDLPPDSAQGEELYLDMDLPPQQDPEGDELYLDMELPPVPVPAKEEEELYLAMDDHLLAPDETDNTYDLFPDNTYDFTEIGTLPTRGSQCFPVPDKVRVGVAEKVVVVFLANSKTLVQNFDGSYKIHIGFDKKSADVVATYINPHTLRFESPKDLPGGMYKCTLTHNGTSMATFKLGFLSPSAVLSDIISKAVNPLNYLCDVLGISPADSNQLDNELHEQCKKYMPERGFSHLLPVKETSVGKQGTTFPTALHFASKFGLLSVCAMLCEWPGGDQALRIKNNEGKTPDQMTKDENVKSFLVGRKERSVSQQPSSNIGYVVMTQKEQQKSKLGGGPNSPPDQDNPRNRPEYDFPFPVAIPVNPSKEADIHRLISGDPDDIYDYYDSWGKTDNTMVRDGDDDDDDDDTQDLPPPPPIPRDARSGPISDYETLDSEASSTTVSHHDAPPSVPVSSPDERPEPPAASRKPVQAQSDSRNREPDAKLQSLIDIQNRVKDNEISMDEAVNLFRQWEESHNHTQSMSTRRGNGDRQSNIQKLFKWKQGRPNTVSESVRDQRSQSTFYRPTLGNSRSVPHASTSTANSNFKGAFASQQGGRRLRARSEPVATGFTSLTSKHHKEAALRSVSANSYGIPPQAARGRVGDIAERPERNPTNPGGMSVSSRLNATNGTSENSNGPDAIRNENGSDSNPMEPPPPRSPRQSSAKDPAKRISWRNQANFSDEYINRPIPPIPPRNTSAAPSNYSRLPGARPVLMFPPEHRGRSPLPDVAPRGGGGAGVDSDAIPEHSEHSVPQTPEGLPDRVAPPPPRRSISRSQSPLRHSLRPILLGHKFVTSMRAGRSSTFSSSSDSNENSRSNLGDIPRRQSDPSVPAKDGAEPVSPSDRDASGKPKRPIPRPRGPRPR